MITPSFSLTATERVLPRLALDFTTASLDSRITFTRAGNTATVINSSGLVAGVNADIPRFDYDPISLVCKGLLIEESRTNVVLQSGSVTDPSGWSSAQVGTATITPTLNYTTSPDGANTASRVIFNNNGGTGTGNYAFFYAPSTGRTIGTSYADSIWLKTNDGSTVTLSARDDIGNRYNQLITVTPVWTRFSFAGVTTSTSPQTCKIWIRSGVGTSTYADISAWGGQSETGAFATSYIPTVASQVTRTADLATMTGTNFSDWYNASEGTLVGEYTTMAAVPSSRYGYAVSDNTTSNFIGQRQDSARVVVSGSTEVAVNSATNSPNTTFKSVIAYKLNDFAANANNVLLYTDSAGAVPTVSQLMFGDLETSTNRRINCWMRKFNFYNQRLTNAEVSAFSK